MVALIDRKINQYMSVNDGIVKKLEKDKYFFVIKKSYYKEMEKNKFAVLDEAKSVNIGNTMPATLSIGIGLQQIHTRKVITMPVWRLTWHLPAAEIRRL